MKVWHMVFPLAMVWMVFTASKCKEVNCTVSGKVEFRGVQCQPGQPDFNVPPCSGPYPNYDVVVFAAANLETPLVTQKTGPDGRYTVQLPAGEYVIVTQNGPMAKNKKENKFALKSNEKLELNLTVYTGIQ